MSSVKPQWVFTCTANRIWMWRHFPKDGSIGENGGGFVSLDEATADATKHGFNPFDQYWIARVDGRTTHYRPHQAPESLLSREDEF